jgi:hypothetical protein
MNEWINVNEKMPEEFVEVLVYAKNEINVTFEHGEGYLAIDRICTWNDDYPASFRTDRFFGKVSHWMPLPSPPIPIEVKD